MGAKTVLVMAGGTGGHVFPGLAIAHEFSKRGFDIEWLGTEAGIESTLVPQNGIHLHCIPVRGIRGKSIKTLLLAPFNIIGAVVSAMKVIRRVRPSIVIGLGGYVSAPGGVAARIKGIPLVIHEQNALSGTTNKLLSKIANKVFVAFPCGLSNGFYVGNPVRKSIETLESPDKRMIGKKGKINLLILGGSRGALAINELVPAALNEIDRDVYSVWHQTGEGKDAATIAAYGADLKDVKIEAFIDDMAAAFAWADLVICRSGALTVSEISAAGVASILIPFPYAIDDHQTENAKFLADAGAAIVKQQSDLDVSALVKLFNQLFSDRDELLSMAMKARAKAKFGAAVTVVDRCEELLNEAA